MSLLPKTFDEWIRTVAVSLVICTIATLLTCWYTSFDPWLNSASSTMKSMLFAFSLAMGAMCFVTRTALRTTLGVLAVLALLGWLFLPQLAH
jgi:hypothetical protein